MPSFLFLFCSQENVLKIENVQESDTGMYTCLAQNAIGSVERNCEVRVKNKGPRIPRIIIKPFDIDVPQFSSVEMPCKVDGEPQPHIEWLKNNEAVVQDKVKFRYIFIEERDYNTYTSAFVIFSNYSDLFIELITLVV